MYFSNLKKKLKYFLKFIKYLIFFFKYFFKKLNAILKINTKPRKKMRGCKRPSLSHLFLEQ